jgi:hypothetical protein
VASKIELCGEPQGYVFGADPGTTQFFQTTGEAADSFRFVTYCASPFVEEGTTGTNTFEVHDVSYESDAAVPPDRRILFQVTSTGTLPLSEGGGTYRLYVIFTDTIPG